ncbi:MAG: alpha/beta hydrolase [Clostridia bacterium]|nr:alpha/beta hydrolase [Clostridia bacterium]
MGKILNDLKCTLIQKAVYAKIYKGHKPNEWVPWHTPEIKKLESGMVCRSDVKYGETYPNSFADIWYPDGSGEKRPVVVYFHGGGFIFGNKSAGDPMQTGSGGVGKLEAIVKAGFILVNADYALAPQYRFPVQIQQCDELLRYLLAHEEELHLDMSRVCLSGGSAGANMTEIYAACVCNPDYAARLGINPIMTPDNLKVLAIDEAALDASVYDSNMYAMLGCAVGAKRNTPQAVEIINAKTYIRDQFIPSWINASNEPNDETGWFITEGRDLKKKLDEIGVPNELVFFPGEKLPHGYMDRMESDPHALQAFHSMMAFIQKYI